MSQDQLVYANQIINTGSFSSDNAAITTDGSGNLNKVTGITGTGVVQGASLKTTAGKITMSVLGDILDLSGATGKIGVGTTSTKLQFQLAATTNNLQDSATNEIPSCARSTFSSITATNHLYAGTTPNTCLLNQQTGTATATAIGTIGATQYTPTGGVSATYAVLTYNA